jgi:hypothetical protein
LSRRPLLLGRGKGRPDGVGVGIRRNIEGDRLIGIDRNRAKDSLTGRSRLRSARPNRAPLSATALLCAAVRWPASNSRARWRIRSAWLSIERTGTNRWPGRLIAS